MVSTKKSTIFGIVGGLALTVASVPALSINSYATGSSSFFDLNAKNCIIENYNNQYPDDIVASIEEIDFSKITTLDCSNRGITLFEGVTLMPNLESLNLSGNSNLSPNSLDFSLNKDLKTLLLDETGWGTVDVSQNTKLETLSATKPDGSRTLTTAAYATPNDDEEKPYKMDLSGLKFIKDKIDNGDLTFHEYAGSPFSFDEDNYTVYFANNGALSTAGVRFDAEDTGYLISTRAGHFSYQIYLQGNEDIEKYNPHYISEGYVTIGETIDTDEISKTLQKIFNLNGYTLSKVSIVPPSSLELSVDEESHKVGTLVDDGEDYYGYTTINFYYDIPETPAAPNTGFFTKEGVSVKSSNVVVATSSVITLSLSALFVSKKAKLSSKR